MQLRAQGGVHLHHVEPGSVTAALDRGDSTVSPSHLDDPAEALKRGQVVGSGLLGGERLVGRVEGQHGVAQDAQGDHEDQRPSFVGGVEHALRHLEIVRFGSDVTCGDVESAANGHERGSPTSTGPIDRPAARRS